MKGDGLNKKYFQRVRSGIRIGQGFLHGENITFQLESCSPDKVNMSFH